VGTTHGLGHTRCEVLAWFSLSYRLWGDAVPTIRIASANIEWMNNWFTGDAEPVGWKAKNSDGAGTFVPRAAADRAAEMLKQIDADIVAVEEAPSRAAEMKLFIDTCLTKNGKPLYDFILGDSGGQQKLAVLFRPELKATLTASTEVAPLMGEWQCDVDGDMRLEGYEFTRFPLLADVKLGTDTLRIIVLHTKSNFVNQGEKLWKTDPQEYVNAALKNRRRISTEGMRLRGYLDELVGRDLATRVIVLGDFNDGPGMDYFEERYLSHSVTDILVGSAFEPQFVFAHAQHDVPRSDRYSAVFDDFVENVKNKRLLLDHILLSPGLLTTSGVRKVADSGRIHHAEWEGSVQAGGTKRDQRPSDHRPVSVELQY
jgi:endonuclease/exonuclease/phosphatase family metal-dependent hydrolase